MLSFTYKTYVFITYVRKYSKPQFYFLRDIDVNREKKRNRRRSYRGKKQDA